MSTLSRWIAFAAYLLIYAWRDGKAMAEKRIARERGAREHEEKRQWYRSQGRSMPSMDDPLGQRPYAESGPLNNQGWNQA